MSIANSTLHFHFPLVTGTDRPLFEDYNQAMETLDEQLYASISTLETIPQEITDLQTAVNGIAEQISALETFETEQTGTNQLVNNAILALQQAVAVIPTKFDSAGIADPYDAEHGIYAVGDVVTYNGQRYECTQAVTAAEPFDADKWSAVDVQSVLSAILSELGMKSLGYNWITADNPFFSTAEDASSTLRVRKSGKVVTLNFNLKSKGALTPNTVFNLATLANVSTMPMFRVVNRLGLYSANYAMGDAKVSISESGEISAIFDNLGTAATYFLQGEIVYITDK